MERKRISVQTPIGVLHAEVGMDEVNYPEIFVYLEREDGVEIDLVSAGVDVDYHITNAFLFGDTSTEEWTARHSWTEDEIKLDFGV